MTLSELNEIAERLEQEKITHIKGVLMSIGAADDQLDSVTQYTVIIVSEALAIKLIAKAIPVPDFMRVSRYVKDEEVVMLKENSMQNHWREQVWAR